MNPNPIFLVVGPPAVGKSTTSRALAAHFPKSLHIPVDDMRDMVVSGLVLPSADWNDALIQQLTLARTSVAYMALSYHNAGFSVVIDDFWDANHPSDYQTLFSEPYFHKIVLYPSQTVAHQRNLNRSGKGSAYTYIDEGIKIVYQQLKPIVPQLAQQGWVVVDTTAMAVEAVISTILERTNNSLA